MLAQVLRPGKAAAFWVLSPAKGEETSRALGEDDLLFGTRYFVHLRSGICPSVLVADLSWGLEGGALPGSSPEKVLPNPTWAMFAVSGLVAWLIDNWLCTRPFAFVLIFIPTSDISNVRCCPGSESQAGEPDWTLRSAVVQSQKNSGWRDGGGGGRAWA